jgi:hypothetical protein
MDDIGAPLKILREATRSLPAMRYALGVAGILSVVSLVGALRIDWRIGLFGTIIMLLLMSTLVIFARASTLAPKHLRTPAIVLIYAALVLVLSTAVALFTSVFWGYPLDLRLLLSASSGRAVMSVAVYDRETDKPIDNARVAVHSDDKELDAPTDHNGVVAFADLTSTDKAILVVRREGYETHKSSVAVSAPRSSLRVGLRRLPVVRDLTCEVRSTSGEAVQYANVRVVGDARGFASNQHGLVELPSVNMEGGPYRVLVSAENFSTWDDYVDPSIPCVIMLDRK